MEKDLLAPALMAAESEINLILDGLATQFHNEILELLKQPDERWIERVQTFEFQKNTGIKAPENPMAEPRLNAAKRARFLFLLKGLSTKKQLKKITEAPTPYCLAQMLGRLTPEDEALLRPLTKGNNIPRDE